MFPGFIRTREDAIAYLDDWIRALGGHRLGGIDATVGPDSILAVRPFAVELPNGHILTMGLVVDNELASRWYKFDLRKSGKFLWRLDLHPGHEAAHGSAAHLHMGPHENYRVASGEVSLADVADRIHDTLRTTI